MNQFKHWTMYRVGSCICYSKLGRVKRSIMETPIFFPMPPEEYWHKFSQVVEQLLNEKLKERLANETMVINRPYLTIKEVCDLFQITKPTIYEWTRHGKLKPRKIRNRVYFFRSDIEGLFK